MVAIVVRLAVGGGGGDDSEPPAPVRTAPQGTLASYPVVGVRVRYPPGWQRLRDRRVVRLRSRDRSVGVTIAPAPRSVTRQALRRQFEETIGSGYRDVQLRRRRHATVAGRPALASELTAANAAGEELEILLITVASRWRTYGITLFTAPGSPAVEDARAVLESLELTRPRRG